MIVTNNYNNLQESYILMKIYYIKSTIILHYINKWVQTRNFVQIKIKDNIHIKNSTIPRRQLWLKTKKKIKVWPPEYWEMKREIIAVASIKSLQNFPLDAAFPIMSK